MKLWVVILAVRDNDICSGISLSCCSQSSQKLNVYSVLKLFIHESLKSSWLGIVTRLDVSDESVLAKMFFRSVCSAEVLVAREVLVREVEAEGEVLEAMATCMW